MQVPEWLLGSSQTKTPHLRPARISLGTEPGVQTELGQLSQSSPSRAIKLTCKDF